MIENPLTDQFISDTYGSVLHVGLTSINTNGVTKVEDGLGNVTSLSIGLSGSGATITGKLTAGNIEYPENPIFIKFIDWLYPVGSVILSTETTNPSARFTGTNWTQVSQGRVIVGAGTGTDKNNITKTFEIGDYLDGEYEHNLTEGEIPDHYHHILNTDVINLGDGSPALASDNYANFRRNSSPAVGTGDYYFDKGSNTEPTLGKTSGVVTTETTTPLDLSTPSYGVYVWKRTS